MTELRDVRCQPKANPNGLEMLAEVVDRSRDLRTQTARNRPQTDPKDVIVGALIVPIDLFRPAAQPKPDTFAHETKEIERLAMEAVMAHERTLGFEPRDVSKDNLGYDIESKDPRTGRLRFIEVKGRIAGADTITITRNEMMSALNSPDQWRLAIVIVDGVARVPVYVAHPFTREPQFGETSANFNVRELVRFSRGTVDQSTPAEEV